MSTIEDDAFQLPHRERARLALRLIESLDPGRDEDVDELWLTEAERRLKKYDAGEADAREFENALADIETKLR